MDAAPDSPFPDLGNKLKSWFRRSEPANVSRDFWMPDQSCRVCYDCDTQFSLFNRRHHCRHCGRVFCGKCTSNWIPAVASEPGTDREEWEKVRVCNFCFKQWKQGLTLTVTVDHGIQPASLDLSASPSTTSFVSSKSSGTVNSSSITLASMPQSDGVSPHQSAVLEAALERQTVEPRMCNDLDADIEQRDQRPISFDFSTNRNSSDDDELGVYRLESKTVHFPHVSGYYGHMQFDDINNEYSSRKVHPDAEVGDSKIVSGSPLNNSSDPHSPASEDVQPNEQKGGHDISDECEAPSSLIAAEDVDAEPVDFENNGILWLPPEPEDEEDERDALLLDDDDDEGDAAGEWSYLRSNSFGSGEYRGREKSNEEQKKVVKNVVDGHFRALVAQLLQVENLLSDDEDDKEGWLEIITTLSWEAALLLKPDTSKGGGMDPGGYVKVKCIASGQRSDSAVVKGVVCKKNVAHRRMTSKIEKPRVLILGGALEYQRVSNLLSSFDTLLQQEMDHLKMAVAKIDSHNPDVLLVEKSVSRYAQEYLLAKDISLVLNIKRPLLERIARCTGSQIVPSIDHLSSPKLGHCDSFHVERFLENHGSAGQSGKKLVKTLMYFEGCPKPLGCTILLRGASGDELKKVKHVVQYGVFAAYHVALETSFLADEGASLPEHPLQSITVALPDAPSTIDRSISTIPGFTAPASDQALGPQSEVEPRRADSLPTSEQSRTSNGLNEKLDLQNYSSLTAAVVSESIKQAITSSAQVLSKASFNESSQVASEGRSNGDQSADNHFLTSNPAGEGVMATGVLNYSNATQTNSDLSSTQLNVKQTSGEPVTVKEDFPPSPSDHQSILVTLSSRCVWKGTVCERSHLFRIKYYGNFDKPLGRFLRDHLFDPNYRCRSCEMPSEAHVQCYTHRQGTLTISVKKLPEILLPGERDGKIWMWHRCLRCPRINGFPPATRRVLMSDAAWGLSFGKFLELSFSNHAAASRVASCGHSLHRDCLRFYGFGKMVACFRYASIDVHSVYLPPSKLDFNYENQEWIQRELNEIVGRAELLFSEVQNALRQLMEKKFGPDSRRQIADLETMLQNERAEFQDSREKITNNEVKKGQPAVDILEINRLRRQLLFQSYMWDHRLIYVASSDNISPTKSSTANSTPSAMPQEDNTDANVHVKAPQSLESNTLASADVNADKNDDREVGGGAVLSEALHDIGTSDVHKNSPVAVHQVIDTASNPEDVKEHMSVASTGTDVRDEPDLLASNLSIRRVHSDGLLSTVASLSDTLDAAWTGENHPGVTMSLDGNQKASDTAALDLSTAGRALEKLDLDNHGDEFGGSKIISSLFTSSRSSDSMEDGVTWLGLPFISFYRSWNKSFLGNTQKLNTLNDYDPVYISSFRESELRGGARMLLPVGINDHVIPVYDDEPTSAISFALASPDYLAQLLDDFERPREAVESALSLPAIDSANFSSFHIDDLSSDSYRSLGSGDESLSSMSSSRSTLGTDPLSYTKAMHARVSFTDDGPLGNVKYTVTCYYAKRFEALRRISCPSEMDYIRSLSRCKKWGAQGGKSNVFFAKTLDDRFIIKQVTKTELESFIKFAPGYFKYLSESILSGSPTCLAKILGIYQVASKHVKGGKDTKMDVLVMENLLFGRNVTRLYDLKGSSRSRYNPDCNGNNKVLLDQNLIEAMPTSPIFVGNKAKRLLERAVWNDTAFLASIDVMDYSLLVGVDQERHELVLGIIDFMRQYTWDKHLETWAKASGILGGPKNASPTVISPKQYKKRFRKAMTTYFLMVPDQWSPPSILPSKSQADFDDENLPPGGAAVE